MTGKLEILKIVIERQESAGICIPAAPCKNGDMSLILAVKIISQKYECKL
jgi:hypothetical protein